MIKSVHEVLVITLLGTLQFLVLIIVYHVILIIKQNGLLVLDKGPTDGIKDRTGAAKKNLVLTSVKQRQNFAKVYMKTVITNFQI